MTYSLRTYLKGILKQFTPEPLSDPEFIALPEYKKGYRVACLMMIREIEWALNETREELK